MNISLPNMLCRPYKAGTAVAQPESPAGAGAGPGRGTSHCLRPSRIALQAVTLGQS